jgi:hypothetical protein
VCDNGRGVDQKVKSGVLRLLLGGIACSKKNARLKLGYPAEVLTLIRMPKPVWGITRQDKASSQFFNNECLRLLASQQERLRELPRVDTVDGAEGKGSGFH